MTKLPLVLISAAFFVTACNTSMSGGKRQSLRLAVLKLQEAQKEIGSSLFDMNIGYAKAEVVASDRAGDPSRAADIAISQELHSCLDSIIVANMNAGDPRATEDIKTMAQFCVANLVVKYGGSQ